MSERKQFPQFRDLFIQYPYFNQENVVFLASATHEQLDIIYKNLTQTQTNHELSGDLRGIIGLLIDHHVDGRAFVDLLSHINEFLYKINHSKNSDKVQRYLNISGWLIDFQKSNLNRGSTAARRIAPELSVLTEQPPTDQDQSFGFSDPVAVDWYDAGDRVEYDEDDVAMMRHAFSMLNAILSLNPNITKSKLRELLRSASSLKKKNRISDNDEKIEKIILSFFNQHHDYSGKFVFFYEQTMSFFYPDFANVGDNFLIKDLIKWPKNISDI